MELYQDVNDSYMTKEGFREKGQVLKTNVFIL